MCSHAFILSWRMGGVRGESDIPLDVNRADVGINGPASVRLVLRVMGKDLYEDGCRTSG